MEYHSTKTYILALFLILALTPKSISAYSIEYKEVPKSEIVQIDNNLAGWKNIQNKFILPHSSNQILLKIKLNKNEGKIYDSIMIDSPIIGKLSLYDPIKNKFILWQPSLGRSLPEITIRKQKAIYLLRQGSIGLAAHIFLTTHEEARRYNLKILLAGSTFISFFAISFFLSIVSYLFLRRKIIINYLLSTLMFLGFSLNYNPLSSRLNYLYYHNHIPYLIGLIGAYFFTKFLEEIVNITEKRTQNLLKYFRRVLVIEFILCLILKDTWMSYYLYGLDVTNIAFALGIILLLITYLKGNIIAKIELFVWSFKMLTVVSLYTYLYTNILDRFYNYHYIIPVAFILELILNGAILTYSILEIERRHEKLYYASRERTIFQTYSQIIAHDLANPLYALRNTLNQKSLCSTDISKHLDLMENIIIRTKSLDLIKGTFNNSTSLLKACEDIEEMLAKDLFTKNIRFSYKETENTTIPMNQYAFTYFILKNLLSNAIKFTPYDSVISLKASVTPEEKIIHIIDEGEGLNSNQEKSGLGIGLNIVRNILNENNAHLTFLRLKNKTIAEVVFKTEISLIC